jgi:hypothetical protein
MAGRPSPRFQSLRSTGAHQGFWGIRRRRDGSYHSGCMALGFPSNSSWICWLRAGHTSKSRTAIRVWSPTTFAPVWLMPARCCTPKGSEVSLPFRRTPRAGIRRSRARRNQPRGARALRYGESSRRRVVSMASRPPSLLRRSGSWPPLLYAVTVSPASSKMQMSSRLRYFSSKSRP